MITRIFTAFALATLLVWAGTPVQGQDPIPPDPVDVTAKKVSPDAGASLDQTQTDKSFETLTSGPVHEAFAEQFAADPKPGKIVKKNPPEPLNELAPDLKPDGENIQWIPGYWSWDDDRNDFIWISGLWRDLPPGQRWVPGSWVQVDGGFQWVSGFWTSDNVDQIEYLPEPPATQENGPNVASPGDNYFWVPGNWVYNNSYQWQAGYWAPVQQDWAWNPSRYYWTPNGYIYTAGYWDYPPTVRATMFSPVYVPGYSLGAYTPATVIPIGPMLTHFFIRPGYSNYYFGNYYGDSYQTAGYYPWINGPTYFNQGAFYDPLYSYVRFGMGSTTYNRLLGWNQFYIQNPNLRPGRTLAESQALFAKTGTNAKVNQAVIQQATLGADLRAVAKNPRLAGEFARFQTLDQTRRDQLQKDVQQFRDFQRTRANLDIAADGNRNRLDADGRVQTQIKTSKALQLPKLTQVDERATTRQQGRANAATPAEQGRLPEPPKTTNRNRANTDLDAANLKTGAKKDQPLPGSKSREDLLPNKTQQLDDASRQKLDQTRKQLDDRLQNGTRNRVNSAESAIEGRNPANPTNKNEPGRIDNRPIAPGQAKPNVPGIGDSQPGQRPVTPKPADAGKIDRETRRPIQPPTGQGQTGKQQIDNNVRPQVTPPVNRTQVTPPVVRPQVNPPVVRPQGTAPGAGSGSVPNLPKSGNSGVAPKTPQVPVTPPATSGGGKKEK